MSAPSDAVWAATLLITTAPRPTNVICPRLIDPANPVSGTSDRLTSAKYMVHTSGERAGSEGMRVVMPYMATINAPAPTSDMFSVGTRIAARVR